MSLSKSRKNFYRIGSLIIEHGADAMRCLLRHFIDKIYKDKGVSFRDFVINHQHEIYHQFNIAECCQCTPHYQRPYKQELGRWQIEILFDNSGPKLSCHNHNSKNEFCCSIVKHNLQLNDLDITLLKFFLYTYFEDEFWRNCLADELSFHDFLNQNKHDIFHLMQQDMPCCLCIQNSIYTMMATDGKSKLTTVQWKTMFATVDPQCLHCKPCVGGKNPCSVSATKGIHQSSLDNRARMIILSMFCIMMKHIDNIVNARNTAVAHASKGEIHEDKYSELWTEIETSIIYISQITSTDHKRTQGMLELREKSLEESLCLEIQILFLRQCEESLVQECRKLNETFQSLEANVAVECQGVQSTLARLFPKKQNKAQTNQTVKLSFREVGTEGKTSLTRAKLKWRESNQQEKALTLCVILLLICSGVLVVSIITIGGLYLHKCPAEKYIPIFLLVAGCVSIVTCIIKRPDKDTKNKHSRFVNALQIFLFAWLIAGNVWIYRTYGNFSTADPTQSDYCHPMVYVWAIVSVTLIDLGTVIYVISRCITCFKDNIAKAN